MKAVFYISGSILCAECGHFLAPRLVRDANGVPTGEVIVTRHSDSCSLADKNAKLFLPKVEAIEVTDR